jgi:hypothetical protein
LLFHQLIDARTIIQCPFHLLYGILGDAFQLFHQLIVLQHLLIYQRHFLHVHMRQLSWKVVLQETLVIPERYQVVIMENHIGQLGV